MSPEASPRGHDRDISGEDAFARYIEKRVAEIREGRAPIGNFIPVQELKRWAAEHVEPRTGDQRS